MAHIDRTDTAYFDGVVSDLKKDLVAVCVVNDPYTPIEHDLTERGFKNVVPFYDLTEFYRHKHPLSNGWFAGAISPNVPLVMRCWSDDTSRAHHLQFIAWHKCREEWEFTNHPITTYNRFFIPSLKLNSEFLLDVGAHHGDACKKFNAPFAVEPDLANRAVLVQRRCAGTVSPYAVDETEGERPFHEGLGYCSQISTTGNTIVKTVTIDSLELQPTYIKIHIEGRELSALKGARDTLLKHRPKIAVTVYHNQDGIWKTPLWLMENLPDYVFLFRQHSWCGTGSVVYAIPREKA